MQDTTRIERDKTMKYTYKVNIEKMEEIYFENAQRKLFNTDAERDKFNVELIVYADSEPEARQMRIGMSDIRMWDLVSTED